MERVRLSSALELSRIIYGMWRLGDDPDTSPGHIRKKIDLCLEQGITSFDQADIYGGYEAEALLGACLKETPALRQNIEIITKCDIVAPVGRYEKARVKYYDTSRNHILSSVDHSLRLMTIEQIDLLLIHRPDPLMNHHETGAALDEVISTGKVAAVGVSNFRPHDFSLLQSAMTSPLVTNQIELSVIAHQAFVNGDIAFLQERDLKPMAWSPLAGGALFSKENNHLYSVLTDIAKRLDTETAAIAIAWLLAHPASILPVVGTNKLERISALSEASTVTIDRETWFEIYTAALGHEVA